MAILILWYSFCVILVFGVSLRGSKAVGKCRPEYISQQQIVCEEERFSTRCPTSLKKEYPLQHLTPRRWHLGKYQRQFTSAQTASTHRSKGHGRQKALEKQQYQYYATARPWQCRQKP